MVLSEEKPELPYWEFNVQVEGLGRVLRYSRLHLKPFETDMEKAAKDHAASISGGIEEILKYGIIEREELGFTLYPPSQLIQINARIVYSED